MTPFQPRVISLTLYLVKSTAVGSPVGGESCFCVYLILGYFAEVKNKEVLNARVFVQTVLYKKQTTKKTQTNKPSGGKGVNFMHKNPRSHTHGQLKKAQQSLKTNSPNDYPFSTKNMAPGEGEI